MVTDLALWSDVEEVEAPDVCRDARLLSVVAEHANAATLAELAVLVVQVLCSSRCART